MPYIKKSERSHFDIPIEILMALSTPGHLNYVFTEMIIFYLKNKGECYQTYNDIIGALEACKLELYRRQVGDYENKKIQENSDVYRVS